MKVKSIYDEIVSGMKQHNSTMTIILEDFRKNVATAKLQAAAFKDDAGELSKRKTSLIADARQRIAAEDKRLADTVKVATLKLKKELSEYLCKPANAGLLAQLRAYTDFDLKMSRTELNAFIVAAEGNYTALRAIQRVAADSGFSVTIPEGFEEDVAMVERLGRTPSMWCSPDYLAEGMEVLPDIPHFREDGTVAYSADRPDVNYLLLKAGAFSSACKGLESMAEKWGTAFVPSVSELKPIRDSETREVVSAGEQHTQAVEAAADMVEIKAVVKQLAADENCQSVLDHYI